MKTKIERRENISAIVDCMDEVVYVCDQDNYELLYMNESGCVMSGIHQYEHRKCYEVLHNRTQPCPQCEICKLSADQYKVREVENAYMGKHFLLKEKLITWENQSARLAICIDITEKEVMSKRIQNRLDFEKNIVECTKLLVNEPDKDKAIDGLLQSIGEFYDADRAYVFELQENGLFWDNTYEWCKKSVLSQRELLQNVPIEITKRWMELFEKGESIVIEDIDDIKDISRGEWEILEMQKIKKLIVSPIWRNQKVIGFIGVDDPKKHMHVQEQVQTISVFLADRMLKEHNESRLNELFDIHNEDILHATRLGIWMIRLGKDGEPNQMYADQTMREIMGVKGQLTPEECYEHWYSRIKTGYYHYVNYGVQNMIEAKGSVELSYTWVHPIKGEMSVKCLGIRGEDDEGRICLKGYHRAVNEVYRPDFLPGEKSILFEYDRKEHSIYFHNEYSRLNLKEEKQYDFPKCWIDSGMVHPNFIEKFQQLFDNIGIEKNSLEILLKSEQGAFDWYNLCTHYMDDDTGNSNTFIIVLEPANDQRAMELELIRMRDFYSAVLSDKIAYAEVDMKSYQILSSGGAWADYDKEDTEKKSYMDVLLKYKNELIHEDDIEKVEEFFDEKTMYKILSEGKVSERIQFRRLLDNQMGWVELKGHVFQDHVSENLCALFYMKDIDAQKRREIEHELAATTDPLTRVLNRAAFEEEVTRYVKTSDKQISGTLVLIDMDNFKFINDEFGHAEGDRVLKEMAEILTRTFRVKDIIGRFGGDEFLVFLKDLDDKNIIDRRMEELNRAFAQVKKGLTTCSMGITFVKNNKDFSYQEYLKQADEALYQSKAREKNTHSYYMNEKI